ncbi:MAG: hypothetical protein COA78_15205 [Blastopirellula sp.]|nr:MAG: hypothetical protein COA78_15205 [Blastopirellula sp.]
MKKLICCLLFGALAVVMNANEASATSDINKTFIAKYNVKEPKTDSEKALSALAAKAKCNVCHIGKKKKDRNEFGQAIAKLVDKDEMKALKSAKKTEELTKMITDALNKVEKEKNKAGKTFGELIKAGKLPGGEPK